MRTIRGNRFYARCYDARIRAVSGRVAFIEIYFDRLGSIERRPSDVRPVAIVWAEVAESKIIRWVAQGWRPHFGRRERNTRARAVWCGALRVIRTGRLNV